MTKNHHQLITNHMKKRRTNRMYGLHLYWYREFDNKWSYIILHKEIIVVERKDGFRFEYSAIRAGQTSLKAREKIKMEELQQELDDVNNIIEQFLFGKSVHIGVFRTKEEQEELDQLCDRRDNLKELLSFPKYVEKDNQND